jgi:hypothetical protein
VSKWPSNGNLTLDPWPCTCHTHHLSYSPILFIRGGCLPSSLLFFLQWAILIGPSLKKLKLGRLYQSSSFSVLSRLWLTKKDKKRRTLGKGYGIKWGATGNTLRNTLRTWGTSWGTHWEHRRTQEEFKNSTKQGLTPIFLTFFSPP